MNCGHECYKIGGPWIAEDPNCPVHGQEAQRYYDELYVLEMRVEEAETIAALRGAMIELIHLMRK